MNKYNLIIHTHLALDELPFPVRNVLGLELKDTAGIAYKLAHTHTTPCTAHVCD